MRVHKDLMHTQIVKNNITLTLLGFLINPCHVQSTDEENLDEILENAKSFQDVLENTYIYSGRWIIIYNDPSETKIFHDPCGLRQIFYYKKSDKSIWCGSQPNLIADLLQLDRDLDKDLLEYIQSEYYEKQQRAWFGEGTIYKDVKHLLPNNYLDLKSGERKRYWIDKESNTTLESAVETAGKILKGSLSAINHRGEIMIAVTAGWDSRVLLAASKDVSKDCLYYISTMNCLKAKHNDINIPDRLLTLLGLKLHILDNLAPLTEDFKSLLKRNVARANILPKTLTIQYHYHYSQNKININGNGGEIARCTYGVNHPKKIDGKYIAAITGYPSQSYVISCLNRWLKESKEFAELHNLDIIDLFYWEQRMGNWHAKYQAEQDIAIEEFSPYNNRKLLMTLLKISPEHRKSSNYNLYQLLISKLWPETFEVPINPLNAGEKIKMVISDIIPPHIKIRIKSFIG